MGAGASFFATDARFRFQSKPSISWGSFWIGGLRRYRRRTSWRICGRGRSCPRQACTTWWQKCAQRWMMLRVRRGSFELSRDTATRFMAMPVRHRAPRPGALARQRPARASSRRATTGFSPRVRTWLGAIPTARSVSTRLPCRDITPALSWLDRRPPSRICGARTELMSTTGRSLRLWRSTTVRESALDR